MCNKTDITRSTHPGVRGWPPTEAGLHELTHVASFARPDPALDAAPEGCESDTDKILRPRGKEPKIAGSWSMPLRVDGSEEQK